ncbi:GSCOCG00001107001-RA-CDS [Cotesia congregata]|uniref:Similar to Xrcc1: DNA repair protein XRCC1 (Mus musculus) n=1 Tax=Cotesia congregata TaxID=51543 RepID=A0A8J2MRX5_COTCN|nr:GSCOCG00001107001-RA-CDS [Cotesia congregata]CAG5097635.1 Similar to Xrcc1: DNA repair protein XRCC1 (Mus musculus) [Cotesia congregata]
MIIKLEKIISCSSEHPSYPASNLLHNPPPGPWKCAKPGERLSTVIFELPESSCIIGLDIGNYRSCVVIVDASTSQEPDNWVPLVNHQFMTHEEAANSKFKDQVQLFTKKELKAEAIKTKFDRVKVTCLQSANLRELFGLSFITLRTEVILDTGIDVFGRFKLKSEDSSESDSMLNFKERFMKLLPDKQKSYKDSLLEKMKETRLSNFNKRQESEEKKPRKRPLLKKLEAGKSDEVFGKKNNSESSSGNSDNSNNSSMFSNVNHNYDNGRLTDVARTPFGDVIPPEVKKTPKQVVDKKKVDRAFTSKVDGGKLVSKDKAKDKCNVCSRSPDEFCKVCKKLPAPKTDKSPPRKKAKVKEVRTVKKEFSKLLVDVRFSLSGYVNPQRDEVRRKALKMGAKYVADPNTTDNKCTHLICAFKNTPKYQQLQGHAKIVSHVFIEECFDHKKRYPWRRYALSGKDKKADESEEEIEGSTSPVRPPNPYEQETDSDTDDDNNY